MNSKILLVLLSVICCVCCDVSNNLKVIGKVVDKCAHGKEMFKCLKIHVLKATDRALKIRSLDLIDGLRLVSNGRHAKGIQSGLSLNDSKLEKLDDEQLDDLIGERASKFLETHRLEVRLPKMAEEGRRTGGGGGGGGKKGGGGGGNNAALYWALAIKGTFLAVAYKGIAIMAGLALIMGKMALLLAAILGLKKLVSSGHETTTFEIIKQPKYSESHIHTSSYEEEGGHYHRSYDIGDVNASRKIVRAYI